MPKRRKRRSEGKRQKVREILLDPRWSRWSTESIRKRVGVHESVVRAIRDQMYPERKSCPRDFRRAGVVGRMEIAGIQAARQELSRVAAGASPEARMRARRAHAADLDYYRQVRAMLREARRRYAALTGRRLRLDEGGDPAGIPEFELVARILAGDYPDLLGAHGYEGDGDSTAAAERLYELLTAEDDRPRLADAIEQASWCEARQAA
jgi:hypothetical protein